METQAASEMHMSNLISVSTMVRDCLFVTTGDLAHLFPRCGLRVLSLEDEHGGFRHFCSSGFDVKEALFIQARDRERNVGGEQVVDGEGAGEMEGNWVAGRDLGERLLEMPRTQGMCFFARFSPVSKAGLKKKFRDKF